ncbi:MAG: integration host factor subunit beta [Desulfovibrio desulfuricans]|nr:integration host factor subunit beta [Desulfovibrio desulfuricans]
MNRSELIRALAEQCAIPETEAAHYVSIFFDQMKSALLSGSRVEIRGFGTFKIKQYDSYVGRNPKTGEKVTVASKCLPFFRAGRELVKFLNE